MKQIIFASFILVSYTSCISSSKETEGKIIKSVSAYMSDEFFKNNYNLNIIEVRINTLKTKTMDSIMYLVMKEVLLKNAYWISNPDQKGKTMDLGKFTISSSSVEEAKKVPEYLNLKKIVSQYSHDQIGYEVGIYFKSTYTNSNNQSENYLLDDLFFVLDQNFKIIYTPFTFSRN